MSITNNHKRMNDKQTIERREFLQLIEGYILFAPVNGAREAVTAQGDGQELPAVCCFGRRGCF